MRRLLLLAALTPAALPAAAPAGGAAGRARQCPAVKVSCPDIVRPGQEADSNVSVEPAGAVSGLVYRWEVSGGAVAGGQGTPSLKLDTAGLDGGRTITATVEVTGLPEGCERRASCATLVPQAVIGCRFDEYGDIAFEHEKARLDNFAIGLLNDPEARGHLICYGGRKGYAGEAGRRCGRAKRYVATVRGVDPARVVTVDGGFMEDLAVSLWIVPAGAEPPRPTPTVDASEVTFLKRGGGRRPRRR